MQRALMRRVSGKYIDLIACDAYNYDVNQYDCTTNFHANTPYSPELVQLLNGIRDITQGILAPTALGHEPVMFGDLLEARAMKQSMAFLQDLGVMPRLPRERVLSPVVTLQGTKYWVLLLDD